MLKPRSLPHSEEAERALLCSLFRAPDLLDDYAWLASEHFYLPAHSELLATFRSAREKRIPFDFPALRAELKNQGKLDAIGGDQFLNEVWETVPTSVNAGYYAQIVRERHHRRVVIKECQALSDRMYDESHDAHDSTAEIAERTFTRLALHRPLKERSFKDVILSTLAALQERCENQGNPDAVRFGVNSLDRAIGGLRPRNLVLLCGRPGDGKSALSALAIDHTLQRGKPVILFSYEMGAEEWTERMMARKARVDLERIDQGTLGGADFNNVTNCVEKICRYPLFVEDDFSLDLRGLVSRCRQLASRHGQLGLIVADYLQLVPSGSSLSEDRREREVAHISKTLKNLAGELGAPVIAVSSLNDDGKIRESRSPSYDADKIFTVQNPADAQNPGLRYVFIAKNRQGKSGKRIALQFKGEYMDYEEVVNRPEPDAPHPAHNGNGNGKHHGNGAKTRNAYAY
jgi:replicative DNA helicase